ncbi:hypothetical protein BN1723_007607 [Verticillium longisporum]|uniref:VWFA domain-containing protein n=1 Tax=Verticillium longisporum TaxID=100787 RepID=A0A0G4MYZ1_VERLO|nr:hypothetical protein BN1708_001619 [Verticillium longisporum]CRK47550.1 hypothetical protein BN1723_007607 [Verticillium longisporum]
MVSNHQGSNDGPDNGGSTTYSPPEMFLSEVVVSRVHSSMDIWAICCIFIEAAVWVIGGNPEQVKFANQRRKENSSRHRNVGHGDYFHDGNSPLPCVVDTLRLAQGECRHDDYVTPLIVECLLEVLQEKKPESRPEANQLLSCILRVIRDAQAPLQASIPTPTENPSRISNPEPRVDPNPPRPPPIPFVPGQGSQKIDERQNLAEIPSAQQSGQETLLDRSERFKTPHAATTPVPTLRPRHKATDRTSGLNIHITQPAEEASPSDLNAPQQEAERLAPYMDQTMSRTKASTAAMPFSKQKAQSMDTLSPPTSRANGSQGIPNYDTQRAASRGLHRPPNSQSRTSFQAESVIGTAITNTGIEFAGPLNSSREVPAVAKDGMVLRLGDILDYRRKIMGGRQAEKPWRSEKFHFLRDRDHIFLVDNSESMQKYQEEVMKLVEGLAYFLEEADPDGVEMMLVCNTKTTLTKYKSTNLLVARTEDDFAKEQRKECPMEKRLGFVLDEVGNRLPRRKTTTHDIAPIPRAIASFLRKKKRPASIYVLTDGSWSPETRTKACGVDNPIVRIMKTMEERTSERTDVSIQFVRYGNDAAGIQRLNYLDREIAGSSLYNITDHKSAEVPNLWDVLVGSLDQENDRKDEDIVELEG